MAKLRILNENKLRRALSLTATAQAGNLVVDNLKGGRKTTVCRFAAPNALNPTLTVTFTNLEQFNCIVLPFGNPTAACTIRVKGYTLAGDAAAAWDTGDKVACPYIPPALDGLAPGVNNFPFNIAPCAVVYFAAASARKITIEIKDPGNPAGYLEFAYLVMGMYWSPERNIGFGCSVTPIDRSKTDVDAASNSRTERGTRSRKLTGDFKNMTPADEKRLWETLWYNGTAVPMWVSFAPETGDLIEEQMYSVYGKLTQLSKIMMQTFNTSQAPVEWQEV